MFTALLIGRSMMFEVGRSICEGLRLGFTGCDERILLESVCDWPGDSQGAGGKSDGSASRSSKA